MYNRASNTSPLLNTSIEGIAEPIPTLIDSGASTNFLDLTFARKHGIPLVELPNPINVEAIDGKNISRPIRFKARITFTISETTFKQWVYCMNTGESPLILGMSWLIMAQPEIKWAPFKLSFPEQGEASKIEDIPEYISDYADVFSEEVFKKLPPNRIFDCKITFKEGSKLPKPARAYPLPPKTER